MNSYATPILIANLMDDETEMLTKISAAPKGYEPTTALERGLLEWLWVLRLASSVITADGRTLYRPTIEVQQAAL